MKGLKRLYCRVFHFYYREFIEPLNVDGMWYMKCHACEDRFKESMDADCFAFGFD